MGQPTCYVIAHPSSAVVDECTGSLKQHNWPFELFPAVDGQAITNKDWSSIGVTPSQDGKMLRRPGAQGCWMSHWKLWNLCVHTQEPIIIMEHDALVKEKWPADIDIDTQLVKLYFTAECKINPAFGRWSKGAHAYSITPSQAKTLIDHARANSAQAVDKHLGDRVLPWTFYSRNLVELNPRRGPSTTSRLQISFKSATSA